MTAYINGFDTMHIFGANFLLKVFHRKISAYNNLISFRVFEEKKVFYTLTPLKKNLVGLRTLTTCECRLSFLKAHEEL